MKARRDHRDRSFSAIRAVARIMRSRSPLSKKLAQAAEILPGIAGEECSCCAEIEIDDKKFVSRTFSNSSNSVDADVVVSDERIGVVRLISSESAADLSPFADAVALMADLVGYMIEHSQAQRTSHEWQHTVRQAEWGMRVPAGETLEQVKRQTKMLLQKEQEFLHALMNNIPDHIYFKDTDSRFIRINQAHAHWLGLEAPEQAVGKSDFDFFSQEHARQAYEDEQRIMATGKPMVGVEEKETWDDGEETWVSTTKVPLFDSKGRVYGLVGISRRAGVPGGVSTDRFPTSN